MDNMQYCRDCINAKPKENQMWFCPKHRTMITFYTLPSAVMGCKGRDYHHNKTQDKKV